MRLPAEEKRDFTQAADAEGMPLALWLRRLGREAVRRFRGDAKKGARR